MTTRHPLKQNCLSGLLLILWAGTADARVWQVEFFQRRPVMATVKTVPLSKEGAPCPEFFHAAQISGGVNLAQIGTVHVESNALNGSAKPGKGEGFGKVNSSFRMQIEIKGCAFRRYFQARAAHLTITGDLEQGQTLDRTVDLLASDRSAVEPGLSYTANLAGTVQGFGYSLLNAPPEIAGDQIAGTLLLTLPHAVWPVAAEGRPDSVVQLRRISLQIYVRSGDSADQAQSATAPGIMGREAPRH